MDTDTNTTEALTRDLVRAKIFDLSEKERVLVRRAQEIYANGGGRTPTRVSDQDLRTKERARQILNGAHNLLPATPTSDNEDQDVQADSLSQARSVGIDTRPLKRWAERILDSGDSGPMPRRALEDLRSQASSAAAPTHYTAAKKPETREQRMRHAAELQRSVKRPANTLTERRMEVADIKRRLRAEGLI